jgi:G:T/U-mismatch repair DNA glycosylase
VLWGKLKNLTRRMSRDLNRSGCYYGCRFPDLLGSPTRLLFVGINPALTAVATQAPFTSRTNRFYRALYEAGITDHVVDASACLSQNDGAHLGARGVGTPASRPGRQAKLPTSIRANCDPPRWR